MLWPSKLILLFYIGNIMCLTSHCVKSLILAISLWGIKEKISKLWKIENCDMTVNNNYYITAIGKIVHFWGLFFKFYNTFLKFLLKHRSVNYQTQVYNISFYIVITINFVIPWVVGGQNTMGFKIPYATGTVKSCCIKGERSNDFTRKKWNHKRKVMFDFELYHLFILE
jgi:hypothetical protein